MDATVWAQSVGPGDRGQMFDSLRAAVLRERKFAGDRDLCAVIRFDGHGGSMQRFAFSRAVKRVYGDTVHVVDIGTRTGAMVDFDQVTGQDEVAVLRMPPAAYDELLPVLCVLFDIVYHAMYVVKGFARDPELQGQLDTYLDTSGLRPIYDGMPQSLNALGEIGLSQWDLMSASSGIEVTPEDMYLPLDVLPVGEMGKYLTGDAGCGGSTRASLNGVGRYVVVHNTPGARAVTKAIPFDTMQAAIDVLADHGLRAVQVGTKAETRYKNVVDRRGLRWPLTAQVMQGAAFLLGLEGGLAYMAHCTRTPAVILFGCTPPPVFGFEGNTNVCMNRCPSCFWGWPGWHAKCIREKQNPAYPFCENMPTVDEIGDIVNLACIRHAERMVA